MLSPLPLQLSVRSLRGKKKKKKEGALVRITYLTASVSQTVNKRKTGPCFINDVSRRAGGMKAETTVYF